MDFLQTWLESSDIPVLTAFILGLLTAVSPCPLATNITVIAFMMAVVGLSLPEATLLKKVMTWRLIFIFFSTVTLFIIFSGYLFNALM